MLLQLTDLTILSFVCEEPLHKTRILEVNNRPFALGSLFLENIYITGYNLKNASNGKSESKILKRPSLNVPDIKE